MENNLDSALEYLKSKSVRNEDFMDDGMVAYIANHLVGYAASVSPKLVLPSDEDKQNAYLNMYPEMEESDGFDDGFIEAWEAYESELRRLNPSLFK